MLDAFKYLLRHPSFLWHLRNLVTFVEQFLRQRRREFTFDKGETEVLLTLCFFVWRLRNLKQIVSRALSAQPSRHEDSINLICQILQNEWMSQGMIYFTYESYIFKSSGIIMSLFKKSDNCVLFHLNKIKNTT